MSEQTKLFIFADGPNSADFLQDIEQIVYNEAWEWNDLAENEHEVEPIKVTIGGGGVQHGW